MMDQFYVPTEILLGRGALSSLGKATARYGRRAMLVCGAGSARRSGLLDRALTHLRAADIEAIVYDEVHGEANLGTVDAGIDLARRLHVEVIIGLGGGSAIDTAKAIAGTAPLPGSIWEYHGGRAIEAAGLPFVAVPTTAGTGAEVTKNAVLIDPRNKIKYSIRDDRWFARLALLDPETTLSMSPEVTAGTGSDALVQAIESYTSIGANAVTDALAYRAIELIGANLARAYSRPDDLDAREAMMAGSLMAGMAMASARLGGVHGMAHPLGSHYKIPHGVVCGLLLPYTMAYNVDYATAKYARVGVALGIDACGMDEGAAAQAAVDAVRDLLREVNIPEHLSAYGVSEDTFAAIIEESLPSGSLKHNPRPLAAEDVRRILEAAL
jgi:alcohol dehydrogenase class IV